MKHTHKKQSVFCYTEVSSSQDYVLVAHTKYLSSGFIFIT